MWMSKKLQNSSFFLLLVSFMCDEIDAGVLQLVEEVLDQLSKTQIQYHGRISEGFAGPSSREFYFDILLSPPVFSLLSLRFFFYSHSNISS